MILCLYKYGCLGIGIPILKIKRSWDRLISKVGIPVLVDIHLCSEKALWFHNRFVINVMFHSIQQQYLIRLVRFALNSSFELDI